jgi:predicted aspartyl protease
MHQRRTGLERRLVNTAFSRNAGNLLTMEVSVNGHILRALLDTGTRTTTINDDAARRLGLGSGSPLSAPVIRGEDGSDIIAHTLAVTEMTVGSMPMQNGSVLVAPILIPFADMILGADRLQHHDIWVSYNSQQAFIR